MAPKKKPQAEASKTVTAGSTNEEKSPVGSTQGLQLRPQKPDPRRQEIKYGGGNIAWLRYYPFSGPPALVFTHGAGGTFTSAAMVNFAAGFNESEPLLYFQGPMNLTGRTKMFHAVIEHEGQIKSLGGRSMGARAAVMAAHTNKSIQSLILASYPLKNEKGEVRDQILLDLRQDVDVLFISGDGDKMCNIEELNAVRNKMKAKSWLVVVEGADHGMNTKPKKATDEVGRLTGKLAAEWLRSRQQDATERTISSDISTGKPADGDWKAKNKTIDLEDKEDQSVDSKSSLNADREVASKPKRRKLNRD